MKYSLTRGLAELKTLKARYQKVLNSVNTIAVKKGEKLLNPFSSYKEEDFVEKSKAEIQSVEAIEKRIIEIKTKIDAANSTTVVKIGKKEMTIQQALVEKSFISLKKTRLAVLKAQLTSARGIYDRAVNDNQRLVESLVNKQIEAFGTSGKVDTTEIAKLQKETEERFEKTNKIEFVDPLNLAEKVKSLEDEIEDFETNVDFALSEINSTTTIEVDD